MAEDHGTEKVIKRIEKAMEDCVPHKRKYRFAVPIEGRAVYDHVVNNYCFPKKKGKFNVCLRDDLKTGMKAMRIGGILQALEKRKEK